MKALIALILSAIIAIPVFAMPPGDGSHMMKGLTRNLDLTEEQQAQVQKIFDSKQAKREAIRTQMEQLKAETDGEIKTILTPDQQKKFEEMQAKRKQRFEEMRDNKGHHKHKGDCDRDDDKAKS